MYEHITLTPQFTVELAKGICSINTDQHIFGGVHTSQL